ncbi:hypothetical protein PHJA_000283600 [Phtheirospermum japonicum]|uniref:Uncharacterized protein n=1 Tax=Phtheirospermum japonicum TaxID=374723 RepID=A0A830BAI0_9LAMI|nr:hypothetical protein PHJA_000283600 [Phtheirospermum japonicum]
MASADPLTRVDEKLFKGSAMTKRDAYAVISYMTCADIAVKLYRWNVQRDVTGSIIMWLILRPCLVGLGAPALTGLLFVLDLASIKGGAPGQTRGLNI